MAVTLPLFLSPSLHVGPGQTPSTALPFPRPFCRSPTVPLPLPQSPAAQSLCAPSLLLPSPLPALLCLSGAGSCSATADSNLSSKQRKITVCWAGLCCRSQALSGPGHYSSGRATPAPPVPRCGRGHHSSAAPDGSRGCQGSRGCERSRGCHGSRGYRGPAGIGTAAGRAGGAAGGRDVPRAAPARCSLAALPGRSSRSAPAQPLLSAVPVPGWVRALGSRGPSPLGVSRVTVTGCAHGPRGSRQGGCPSRRRPSGRVNPAGEQHRANPHTPGDCGAQSCGIRA